MINRKVFFDAIRSGPFPGTLTPSQVQGAEAILSEWERRGLVDLRQLAYMLATAYHETAFTMCPIREIGSDAYLTRMYDVKGARPGLAQQNGNINPGDGKRFCGRGYVQLTWRANYKRMGERINQPLEDNPDLAMRPDIAAAIMFEGMIRGLFTGKKLAHYFNETADWVNARRIINGTDKAEKIAGYAKQFHAALAEARTVSPAPKPEPQPVPEPKPAPKPTKEAGGAIATGGGGAVVVTELSKGASDGEIAMMIVVLVIVVVGVFFFIRHMRKGV